MDPSDVKNISIYTAGGLDCFAAEIARLRVTTVAATAAATISTWMTLPSLTP